jgi:hypothetical protein
MSFHSSTTATNEFKCLVTPTWGSFKAKWFPMITARKFTIWNIALFVVLVILVQQVVSWGWISDFDKSAMRLARDIQASQDIFSVTVMLGLRGIILTICIPWMAWLSWKRRTWIPIAGFVFKQYTKRFKSLQHTKTIQTLQHFKKFRPLYTTLFQFTKS